MLTVTGLSAFYGRAQALFDVDLRVGKGQVAVLLGPNGAGKSTTLKCIMGLVRAASGRVRFDGEDTGAWPTHRLARAGLGYVPEDRRIFQRLTVRENLDAGRQPPRPGVPAWTAERVFELFPNLKGLGRRVAGHISGGEQQMLTLARTLMGNPKLVLLDEPTTGLAPRIVEQLADTLRTLKTEGLTLVISEQSLPFAERVADRAVVIETGHVRWQGPMTEFGEDSAARREYLRF